MTQRVQCDKCKDLVDAKFTEIKCNTPQYVELRIHLCETCWVATRAVWGIGK